MRVFYRLGGVIGAASLLLTLCLLTVIAQAAPSTPTQNASPNADAPMVGFVADGDAVNAAGKSGQTPALVVNPQTHEPWVAFAQNNQVVVNRFITATKTWTQQGGVLNFNVANTATQPALAFASTSPNTPWVAWSENISGVDRILAARLDGQQWTFAGELVKTVPSLNQPDVKFVYDPVIAVGAPITGEAPLPWVAWGEGNGFLGHLEVRRAVSDVTALGGLRWQPVITPTSPSIAYKPDLVFSGPNNRVPWLVWSTNNDVGFAQVFAARALSDTAVDGSFHWERVNTQANCEQAAPSSDCPLNLTGGVANGIRIASGVLPGESAPTPWIAFAQVSTNSVSTIHVMRLDVGTPTDPTDDRFIPVGGAVNSECLQRDGLTAQSGDQPDIYFVGNVPHIVWIEHQNGVDQLLVCHLADARPGQERWDLDTITPVNRQFNVSAMTPSLGSNGTTPYVAWQEGENPTNIFVAHRTPDSAAWGRNYPPFIRTISWSRNVVGQVFDTSAIKRALDHVQATTNPILFTTSCNHANGWEHIKEVQFKLANANMTAFLGKYVAAENQVYVEVTAQPGAFLGPFTLGAGQPVEGQHVILNVPDMKIHNHGAGSPALDIDWPIVFKESTKFQDFVQSINIVYDDGQSTGFFNVGLASLDYRLYLPAVNK